MKYIMNYILEKYRKTKNPFLYWKDKGVNFYGKDYEIYSSVNFGSEPYLISIGEHVRINAGVQFVTHDGGVWVCREFLREKNAKSIDLFGKIKIGNNVHIGTNAIIMPGVIIGDNCIIGCGAIVTKDIPNNSIAVGIPAKVIETLDEYIIKNKKRFLHTKKLSKEEKREYLKNILK